MTDDQSSTFLRLFIALAVPPDVQREIGRAQGQLQRDASPGVIRWTRPEQFHVTLKYLGDVPASQVGELEKSVASVCAGCPSLRLLARGVGFFPSTHRPRIVWVGARDECGKLADLHRLIDEATRSFAPTEKPDRFTGHITLGRFKPGRPGSVEKLLKRTAALRDRTFGNWLAGEVEIVRSELTSAGARHSLLVACRLWDD